MCFKNLTWHSFLQLREEFDSSQDVRLNEEHNPHDVAALLKEYFRDLPDPLLTRDLYAAFIATRSKSNTLAAWLNTHLVTLIMVEQLQNNFSFDFQVVNSEMNMLGH